MACINYCYCPLLIIGEIWAWLCMVYFAACGKIAGFFRRCFGCCCSCCKKTGEDNVEAGLEMTSSAPSGASKADRADATDAERQPFLAKDGPKEDHGACCESDM